MSTSPEGVRHSACSPRKPASSDWFGLQISTYGNAFVQFSSSSGVQRSGTGSQMKMGFSIPGCKVLRFRRIASIRFMHRVGEQIRWNDFENRSGYVSECSSRRSFGVVYLKARFWFVSYPFHPLVVNLLLSTRTRQEVSHDSI